MFKCMDCGAVFEEPRHVRECVGEFWGAPAYDDFAYCPACGSDEYDDFDDEEDEEDDEEEDEDYE